MYDKDNCLHVTILQGYFSTGGLNVQLTLKEHCQKISDIKRS
jgi:hypothetical protein